MSLNTASGKSTWIGGSHISGEGVRVLIDHDGKSPKCPYAVNKWAYFSQTTQSIEDDDSLIVSCAKGKLST